MRPAIEGGFDQPGDTSAALAVGAASMRPAIEGGFDGRHRGAVAHAVRASMRPAIEGGFDVPTNYQ